MEEPKHYKFLTAGKILVPGVDDVSEFQSTVKSMQIMGMGVDDINCKFTVFLVYISSDRYFKSPPDGWVLVVPTKGFTRDPRRKLGYKEGL